MIKSNRKIISIEELKSWIDQRKDFLLIDVLPDFYYNQKHLPNAENACVYEIDFPGKVKKTLDSSGKPVVVYGMGKNYHAAAAAYSKLVDAGIAEVYEFAGGIEAWEEAGYPMYASNEFTLDEYVDPEAHRNKEKVKVDTALSYVKWTGRNLANNHFGVIAIKDGNISINHGKITDGNFTIDMNSIRCDDIKDKAANSMLVSHLKSADFFETDRYPDAVFKITNAGYFEPENPGKPNYHITGEFTMKGITKEIEFVATAGWKENGTFYAQGVFEIDRTRWNVMYGSGRFFEKLGMHLVNDLITIELFISAS